MIADTQNLMLNSKERARLYLALKHIQDCRADLPECEETFIVLRWIDDLIDAMDQVRTKPLEPVKAYD